MLTLATQLLLVAQDFPEFSEGLDPIIAEAVHLQAVKEASVRTASTKLKDIMGGKTMFGLKQSVAHRIERQLKLYDLEAVTAALIFESREARLVMSARQTDTEAEPYSTFSANYIAKEIAHDLQRSLAYKVQGRGRYSNFTGTVVLTLIQKL